MKFNLIHILALGAVAAAGVIPTLAADDYVLSGYQCYNTEEKMGWYKMKSDGAGTFVWADAITSEKSYPIIFGWMRDGRLCGVSSLQADKLLYNYDYLEINPENGEYYVQRPVKMSNEDGSTNYLNYFKLAAYNPDDDRVYGYGYNADGSAFVFKSTSHDFTDTKVIRTIPDEEFCSSLTYNETEHRLVGFNRSQFVYIDLTTGRQTNAYYPGLTGNFQFSYTGLVYDVAKRAYYWNYFTKDGGSHMALVDITGQKMTNVCDYTNMTQYSFMVADGAKVSPEAPAEVEMADVVFDKDALAGEVSFRLPSKTAGGTEIAGDISWTLSIDGKTVADGAGKAGESVKCSTGELSMGMHTFDVSTHIGENLSLPVIISKYVGLDTPASPAGVTLGADAITWQPVTTGAHGGYIDPAEVEYRVYFNGSSLGTTKATSIPVTYPEGKPYAAYSGQVSAGNATGSSPFVTTNNYLAGEPLSVPVTFTPDQDQAGLFTMCDADNDGSTWTFVDGASGQEALVTEPAEGTASDDWFFLPPVACDNAETVYSFSVNAALREAGMKPAMLEVRAGTAASPEAMKKVVVPATEITGSSLSEHTGLFTVTGELAGAKSVVIGVRGYAAEGGTALKARRLRVALTKLNVDAPADPTDVKVVAAEKGELRTTVTMTLPTRLLSGEEIPAATDIAVNVFDDKNETLFGKPGETKSITVAAYQGINTVEVTPAIGQLKGNTRKYEVYCGIDVPKAVRNMSMDISDDNLNAEFYWDAPETGVNGGYVDPSDLTYWLCALKGGSYTQYAELGKEPFYQMIVEPGEKLATYQFAIQAVSKAGASPEYAPAQVMLGTPYKLNIEENFLGPDNKPKVNYNPLSSITTGEYENSSWKIINPASVNEAYASPNGVAIVGTAEVAGGKGLLLLPKFSTEGMDEVKFEVEVYMSSSLADVTVMGRAAGMDESVEIGKLASEDATPGYKKLTFTLPAEFENKGWAGLEIVADFPQTYRSVIISGYSVTSKNGSGVEEVIASSELTAIGGEGYIEIAGLAGDAAVYDMGGVRVAGVTLDGTVRRVSMAPGMYAVGAGGKSVKVIVK